MQKHVLAVMAHQDDEVAFLSRLARERLYGNRVSCVYLTNGEAYGVPAAVRNNESVKALKSINIATTNIFFFGDEFNIPDGGLPKYIDSAYSALMDWASKQTIDRIYTLAFEGGHHDHDASHLISAALAVQLKLTHQTWQLPFYHGYQSPKKLFRVLNPLSNKHWPCQRHLTLSEALSYIWTIRFYRSQWKSWVGLFPEYAFQRLIIRQETLAPLCFKSIAERPHPGPLLYERLFGYSFKKFKSETQAFRERFLKIR